jgi:hypothetical protein
VTLAADPMERSAYASTHDTVLESLELLLDRDVLDTQVLLVRGRLAMMLLRYHRYRAACLTKDRAGD